MTISSEVRKAGPYDGNDVTTSFPFSFKVFSANDVVVVLTDPAGIETTLTGSGTDYSVTLNADQDTAPGGSIVLPAPLASTNLLTITSSVPNLQTLDLTNQGGFYPRVINAAFDRMTIMVQQVVEVVGRTLKFPISDGSVNTTLPGRDNRKGRVLAFHETTGDPAAGPSITAVNTVAGAVSAIQTVSDNIGSVNTTAGSIGNVNTVAAHVANVDTVAGHIANVDTVAARAANVDTVAGSIANVNTVAADIAKVNTTAGSIANVNTVAGNIASVNTAAANMAAILAAPTHAQTATDKAAIAVAAATAATNSANTALLAATAAEHAQAQAEAAAAGGNETLRADLEFAIHFF